MRKANKIETTELVWLAKQSNEDRDHRVREVSKAKWRLKKTMLNKIMYLVGQGTSCFLPFPWKLLDN